MLYGAWLVPQFLDERFGPDILKSCWEKFAGFDFSLTAIFFALSEMGINLNDEYSLHVIWNFFTGENYRPGFYAEAAEFDTTVHVARTHFDYPVEWLTPPAPLENVASTYIVFRRGDFTKGSLVIEYFNSTDDNQAVAIAVVRPGLAVEYTIYDIDNGVPSSFSIGEFGRTEKVIMMPIWLFEGYPIDDVTSYTYRAYIDTTVVGVVDDVTPGPSEYTLNFAHPNPFNNSVIISFDSPSADPYRLRVFDITGRLIYSESEVSMAGTNSISWKAPDGLSSGVLFYLIDFEKISLKGKMSLLK